MNEDDKKIKFHEALAFLVESATINNGKVTMDEIKETFEGIIEDESMYSFIYDYLLENKIIIQGYINPKSRNTDSEELLSQENAFESIHESTQADDEKEQIFVNMYLQGIEDCEKLSDSQQLQLLKSFSTQSVATNDSVTKQKLIASNLNKVVELANEFTQKGVSYGDLIQEGNLGLIEGVASYIEAVIGQEPDFLVFNQYMEDSIRNFIKDAILKQNSSTRIGRHVADRANALDRASVELSKELERTPTLEELAKYMSLSTDEVERIMKMSLNALNADNASFEN